jgi:hypothetical protein
MAPVAVLILGGLLIYAGVTGRIEAVIKALVSPKE